MDNSDKPYLYKEGLRALAKEVKGDERIHMGIRPFGFHAGNLVSLYVYPYLFCEEVKKNGKPVRFAFFCSINDYEQDELDGPDYKNYPFNIYPKNTILGYTEDIKKCHEFVTDHWLPIIKDSLSKLKEDFPEVTIYFIKNSDIKCDLKFKEILTSTLQNPLEQAEIYRRFTGKEILPAPIQYAGAVCPVCKKTKGTTIVDRVNGEYVRWECGTCRISLNAPYINYDYWFYHKPLFVARLSIFNIDITFSGDDHLEEGDFLVRREFIKRFNPGLRVPKMFFAPLLVAEDGDKMSKSRKNIQFGDPKKMVEYCRTNDQKMIKITEKLVVYPESDEKYPDFF